MKDNPDGSSAAKKVSLSFVLPLYNEEGNVAPCVFSCLDFARKFCSFYEIIMVNDGSSDKTHRICQDL
ncbi:MAG: glycosyltransferase, partial [Clostridiales bacterium]|nr:glycosyltransferase [Clostridiales bacterium]